MRILLDTNIILDSLLARMPFLKMLIGYSREFDPVKSSVM